MVTKSDMTVARPPLHLSGPALRGLVHSILSGCEEKAGRVGKSGKEPGNLLLSLLFLLLLQLLLLFKIVIMLLIY